MGHATMYSSEFVVNEGENMFNLFKRSRNFPSKYNQQLYFVPQSFRKVQVIELAYSLYTIHLHYYTSDSL